MFRSAAPHLAPAYLALIDVVREDTMRQRPSLGRIPVDLGKDVRELPVKEFMELVDESMFESRKFLTSKSGVIYTDKWVRLDREEKIKAHEKYTLVCQMQGGFVKKHSKYGLLVTGTRGAHPRQGAPDRPSDKNFY